MLLEELGLDMDSFIELFLNIDKHIAFVINTYNNWFYLILFVIIFAETGLVITPFLPGDSLLFACGSFASVGMISPLKAVSIIFIAGVIGDGVNYHIGKFVGVRLMERYPYIIKKEYIEKTHSFYERYGSKTIVLARFVPIVRTFAPFVAGIGYMSYSKFITFNILGAFLWCLIVFGAGYLFGNIPFVKNNFSCIIILIIIISVMPIFYEYLRKRCIGPKS
jgi:membrane-associated protein